MNMKKENIEKRFQASDKKGAGSLMSFVGKTLWGLAVILAAGAWAATKDGTVTATYWTTTYTDPTSTLSNNQAIYGGSQPTVIMKFSSTISQQTGTFKGTYDDSMSGNYTLTAPGGQPFASAGTNYDGSHWATGSWLSTHTSIHSTTTTFNASGDYASSNHSWRDNSLSFTVLLNDANVKVEPTLIKSVQLWKSRVCSTFEHRMLISGTSTSNPMAETRGIVLVQQILNSGSDTEYTFNIPSDVRETTHNDAIQSNTTYYFVTIKTRDDISGNNKWNEGGELNTQKVLDFKWRRSEYYSNTNTTTGYARATDERSISPSVLTFESCVYDILPYEDYTSIYTSSLNDFDPMFGIIKIGPGNNGYPPAQPPEFTNSQIKFVTVNGVNYYEDTFEQTDDAQSIFWATGAAQKTLMPLDEPFAVLGINLAGTTGDESSSSNTDYLMQVDVRITVPANSSFDPRVDLSTSLQVKKGHQNISIFKDTNNNGFFDEADKASGQIELKYDFMSGEVSNSVWTKSGNNYTTTLIPKGKATLEKTQNGISKFFICVCSNPSGPGVTHQPHYGSDFTMKITSVQTFRQAGKDINKVDANGDYEDFVSEFGYTLGTGYDSLNSVNNNYNDVTSRPVAVGLEVSKYVDDHIDSSLDPVLPDPLEADGMPVPVLAINMVGSPNTNVNEKLHSVKVRFSSSGFNPDKHIAPLTGDALSGVSIWKDNKEKDSDGFLGVFDPRIGLSPSDPFGGQSNSDTVVELSPDCLKWYFHNGSTNIDSEWDGTQSIAASGDYFFVLLKFKKAIDLYENDDYFDKSYTGYTTDALGHSGDRKKGKWRGRDYFICIRGAGEGRDYMSSENRGLDYNDAFGVSIKPSEDLLFGYGENAVDPTKLSGIVSTNVKGTMPVFFVEPNTTGTYDIKGKTALLGFSVVAPTNDYSFDHFAFQIIDMNNTFALSDFVDLADTGSTCGISLWRDNGDGRFDETTDQRINTRTVNGDDLPKISTMTWLQNGKLHMIELNLDRTSVGRLPTTDEGRKADFFLVFQPTKNVTIGDALTLQIFGSDLLGTRDDTISFCQFSTGNRLTNPDGSTRTTPGTYKRFRSKTYVAAEAPEDIASIDTDNDGIPDWFEYTYFGNLDTAGPGNVDGYTDFDNDGLNDYYEYLSKTSPLEKDTDHDGVNDPDEDFDSDGLTNLEEQHWRTDPWVGDYDNDGILDGAEVTGGTSPKHSMSPGYNAALDASKISNAGIIVPFTRDENVEGMSVWTVQVMFNSNNQPLSGTLFEKTLSNGNVSFRVRLDENILNVYADCYGGTNTGTDNSTIAGRIIGRIQYPVPVPVDDEWHQVSVTWDGGASSMRLVVDGISQHVVACQFAPVNDWSEIVDDTQTTNGPGQSNNVVNKVHREFTFTMLKPVTDFDPPAVVDSNWPSGVLFDEIRIWNRSLSTSQICDTMRSLVGKDNTGLMRCFRFDDGGTTIEDFAHPGPVSYDENNAEAVNDFIEKNTYPGTPEFRGYALREGFATDWCSSNNGVHLYGIDDEDGDGMPDWYEFYHNVNSPTSDADNDGLVNLYEYLCGTDPNVNNDDYEAACIAGGMSNGEKQLYGLDPRLEDSDGDGVSDYNEISGGVATVYANNVRDGKYITDPLAPLNNEQPPTLKHIQLDGSNATGLVIKANEISKYALSDWTLSAWVKPAAIDQTSQIITRRVSEQAINYELGIAAGIPYAKFVDANGRELQVPEDTTLTTALNLVANEWTHIAATYESKTRNMTLYINGMPVAQVTGRANLECPAYGDGVIGDAFVGASMSIGASFNGLLDNVNIYANALTAEEIAASFRTPAQTNQGRANPYYREQADATEAAVYAANMTTSIASLLEPEHAADRLIIRFSDDVSESMINAASRQYGITVLKKFENTGAYLIKVPKTLDLAKGIEELRKYNAVKYIVPDYVVTMNAKPNDPDYSKLWGLNNDGKNGGTPGVDIGAEDIWDVTKGSRDIVVAVVDTGIDYTHPDLKDNLWTNKGEIPDNGKDDDGNGIIDDYYGICAKNAGTITGNPMDDDNHGTHCAGTIGAVGNNGKGVTGVNWEVKIMGLKGLHPVPGQNASGYISDIVSCIEYAIKHKANVISLSLGGPGFNAAYYDMLNRARSAGILVVAAAGNEGRNNDDTPNYPSDYSLDNIIGVAAMDSNGKPASFTNWSATSIDVAAPGVNIYSTLPGGGYGNMSGTSMATPHVSGLAALLMSAYPSANYALIRDAILKGGIKLVGWEAKPIATMARVSLPGSVEYLNQNVGGLVASFRGNGVNTTIGCVFDLTENEFGAGVAALDGNIPGMKEEGGNWVPNIRKAATGVFATAPADSFAEFSGDSDGDGMPDWYEVAVGHDPNTADGEDDEDKDRLTNYFEFLAGTSPWMQRTDGTTVDRERNVSFTTEINYKKAQEMKFHPLTESNADYTGWDTDDDGISDVDEIGYGAAVETSLPANSLSPYGDKVLRISADDSYLEIPNTIDYALTENWTIDLWVKIDSTLDGDAILVRRFIDTELAGSATDMLTNYEVGLRKESEGWRPYVRFESEDGERICNASVIVQANTLTHIGASYNSTSNEMSLVIDNNFKTTVDCMGYKLPDVMGISHVRVGEGFRGEIDAVRIWKTAADNFNNYTGAAQDAIAGTVPDGLVASFTFDDGGDSAQNFAVAKEDWKTVWINAATLVGTGIAMVPVTTTAPIDDEQEDSDEDGMPDYWERQYFGDLTTADSYLRRGGTNTDFDGDGLNDLYEYWSHTNPTIKQTDGTTDDGNADYDHDSVSNLDEQYFFTRPDMMDTDDDGVNDGVELGFVDTEPNFGFEVSSPLDSLEQTVLDALGHVAVDDNGDVIGLATQEEIERVFRMDGTNSMTVKDNGAHSGENLSFAFVLTAYMSDNGKTEFTNSALPTTDTVFLRRSVKVGERELINYRFTVSSKAIKFQFAQNATVPRFIAVSYAPEEGIQAGVPYYVSAVANLTAGTPAITLKVATKVAGSDTYDNVTNVTNFSSLNPATISGDEGTLTLGFESSGNLVLDVDNLAIWNYARAITAIDPTVEGFDPTTENLSTGRYVSFFRFDDGGVTAEDFGYESDWMNSWKHAGVLSTPSVPVADGTIGKGMIRINGGGSTSIDDNFDADDDGIPDSQESIGNIDDGRVTTDPSNPYDPLVNRALDLTAVGSYLIVENFTGNNMTTPDNGTDPLPIYENNGFTIELWYNIKDAAVTTGPLVQKTNADTESGVPGDFWFGLVNGYLTLRYRNIGKQVTTATFTAKAFNAINSWIHAAVSVHIDPVNQDAMLVNFLVYADGMEYSSATMQMLGVNDAYPNNYSGRLDTESLPGSLVIGCVPSPVVIDDDPNGHINMTVDEVRIWKGARTDTQIATNRNRILTDADAGNVSLGKDNWTSLAAYFRFDDGGNKAYYYTKATNVTNKEWATGGTLVSARFVDISSNRNPANPNDPLLGVPAQAQLYGSFAYLYGDTDEDGIPDIWELIHFKKLTTAGPGDIDHYTDTDGDGINDYYEYLTGRNPLEKDDPVEYDTDEDEDTLTLLVEQRFGTNPFNADSDDDGVNDNEEIEDWGTDRHSYVTNPNFSIAHYGNNTRTPNWALDLSLVSDTFKGFNAPKTDRFVSYNNSYAIEAWFKSAAAAEALATETGVIATLIAPSITSPTDPVEAEELLTLGINAGTPYAKVKDERVVFSEALKGGEWTHLAAVYNYKEGTVSIYKNGLLVMTDDVTDRPKTDYNRGINVIIAGDGTNPLSGGLLDEVRIFNTYRTEDSIRKQMKLASDTHTIGLAAYYRFDDCGLTVEDYMHPYPAVLGEDPFEYSLRGEGGSTSEWLSASDIADPEGIGLQNDPEGTVPNWWTRMYKTPYELGLTEFKGHVYELKTDKLSWEAADKEAEDAGGKLPIISSQAENDFIANSVLKNQRGALIGLSDRAIEGTFIWADGTSLAASSYANWSTKAVGGTTNEPNNNTLVGNNTDEDSAMIVGAGKTNYRLVVGYWNDCADSSTDYDSYIIEYSNYLSCNKEQDKDWDGDGVSNYYEYLIGLNPLNSETVAGTNDGKRDEDRDALTNADETRYGTDMLSPDTDDDGRSDFFEVQNSTNPLAADSVDSRSDYMAILPENGMITYRTDDFSGASKFKVSFEAEVPFGSLLDLVSRAGLFRILLNSDGRVIFSVTDGLYSVQSGALTGLATDDIVRLSVTAEASTLSSADVLDLSVIATTTDGTVLLNKSYRENVPNAGGYAAVSAADVVVGKDTNTASFRIDNLIVSFDGEEKIKSYFNDLGVTFSNAAKTKTIGTRTMEDSKYAGRPSIQANIHNFPGNIPNTTGSLTDATLLPLRHEWFGLSTLVADADGDKMPDEWEYKKLGDPWKAGIGNVNGYTDSDGDGLNDLYEFWAGTDPKAASSADRYFFTMVGDEYTLVHQTLEGDPAEVKFYAYNSGTATWSDVTATLPNADELAALTDAEIDRDGDGLSNLDEQTKFNTRPDRVDTDDDGISDYEEIYTTRTDPTDSHNPRVNRALDLIKQAHTYSKMGSDGIEVEANAPARNNIYAQVVDFNEMSNLQRYTIELWFNLNSDSTLGGNLLTKQATSGNLTDLDDFRLYLDNNGKLNLTYGLVGNLNDTIANRLETVTYDNVTFAAGDGWCHVAVVVQQKTTTVSNNTYAINFYAMKGGAEQVAQETVYNGRLATTPVKGNLIIGDDTSNLSMLIDEVRIWNTARTAANIADNRSDTLDNPADIAVYFSFDDGGESTEADSNAQKSALDKTVANYATLRQNALNQYLSALDVYNSKTNPSTAETQAVNDTYATYTYYNNLYSNAVTAQGNYTPTEAVMVNGALMAITDSDQNARYLDADIDGDGINDAWERRYFGNTTTASATTDYDKDGVSDLNEFRLNYNPLLKVTPNRKRMSVNDGVEKVTKKTDYVIAANGTIALENDPDTTSEDGKLDYDRDGLNNETEGTLGLNPANWDTDDDELADGVEHQEVGGTNPLDCFDPLKNRVIVIPAGETLTTTNFNGIRSGAYGLKLEFWFKLDAGANNNNGNLVYLNNPSVGAKALQVALADGKLQFSYETGTGRVVRELSGFTAQPDTWTHVGIVLTRQSSNSTTHYLLMMAQELDSEVEYLDINSYNSKLLPYYTEGQFTIGGTEASHSLAFRMDEFRVWNLNTYPYYGNNQLYTYETNDGNYERVYYADSIRNQRNMFIYDSTKLMNLAVYYRFDDGGETAEDASYSVKPSQAQVSAYYNQYQSAYQAYATKKAEVDAKTNPSNEEKAEVENLYSAYQTAYTRYQNANYANASDGPINGILSANASFEEIPNLVTKPETPVYLMADSDGDGIADWWEMKYFANLTTANATSDYDEDELNDYYEYLIGCDPTNPDTDGNGTLDGQEDTDGDGLTDAEESRYYTDPFLPDTDDDGVEDKVEVTFGSSPVHPMSIIVTKDNDGQKVTTPWTTIEPTLASDDVRRNYIPGEPADISVDLSSINDAGFELPHGERFAVGTKVIGDSNSLVSGGFTVEMWLKATANLSTTDTTTWIFDVQGNAGHGYRLGLEKGAPRGEIYNVITDETLIYVGGEQATPALENGTWTHLALVWRPDENTLTLYRDKLAIIGSFPTTYNIDLGTNATAKFNKTANVWMDEFRFWNAPRNDREIEYWADRIVPAPLYTTALPIINISAMRKKYALKAYYRFDDGGTKVEDFANFRDDDYMLTGFADQVVNGAKELFGTDDVDGDGIPEWWVYLHNLDTFVRYDNSHPNNLSTGDFDWNDEGSSILGLFGESADVGYTALGGTSDAVMVGVEEGSYRTDNNALSGDYRYALMYKYINLTGVPTVATLTHRNMAGAQVTSVVINQEVVSGYRSGMNVASYLHNGRNQIIFYFTRNISSNYTKYKIPTRKDSTATVDFNRYSYSGSLDVELTVDGAPVIVFGHENGYDPRSVWYWRGRTQYLGSRSDLNADLNGYVLGGDTEAGGTNAYAYNYGLKEDADNDGINVYYEYILNTNPTSRDSDNNGIFDGEEDFDKDGVSNAYELANGTDPLNTDTDNDGIDDQVELGLEDGNPVDWNKPLKRRYLQFANGGEVILPLQSRFALKSSWTLEAYVKVAAGATGTILKRVLGTMDSSKPVYNYRLWLDHGNPSITITDNLGKTETKTCPSAIRGNEWTHIAVSYDATTMAIKLYVNGENLFGASLSRQPQQSGPGIITTALGGDGFIGAMDDVRIWSVVRKADEIKNAMASELSGTEDNLVAYYRFDDVNLTGTTIQGTSHSRRNTSKLYRYAADSYIGSQNDWRNNWLNAAVLNEYVTAVDYTANDCPFVSEADINNNGIPDTWEYEHFSKLLSDDASAEGKYGDFDGDGLINYYEYLASTDPKKEYTGISSTPDIDRNDDGDLLSNIEEQNLGLNPASADSDDDGVIDDAEDPIAASAWSQQAFKTDSVLYLAAGGTLTYSNWKNLYNADGSTTTVDPLAFTGNFTIEFKFRVTALPTSEAFILRKAASVGRGVHYQISLGTDGCVNFKLGSSVLKSLQAIELNKWIYVAAVLSGKSQKLTIAWMKDENAAESEWVEYAANASFSGKQAASIGTDVVIGAVSNGLVGQFDDLRIWSIARSADEIAANRQSNWANDSLENLVANGNAPIPAGMVLYSTFDDRGTTVENYAATRISLVNDNSRTIPDWRMAGVLNASASTVAGPNANDTDNDGIPDTWEFANFGNLSTAGFGAVDGYTDYDGDGLNDLYEYFASLADPSVNPTVIGDGVKDSDGDGLTNLQEQKEGTLPNIIDTDDDGLSDYEELTGKNSALTSEVPSGKTDPLDSLRPSVRREFVTAADSYADLGDLEGFRTGEFTLAAWVKPTAAGAIFVRRYPGNRIGFRFEITNAKRLKLTFAAENYAGEYGLVQDAALSSATSPVEFGVWNHVAVQVYRLDAYSLAVRFFLNGKEVTADDQNDYACNGIWQGLPDRPAFNRIGGDGIGGINTMVGSFFGVKFWNSGAIDIESIYNGSDLNGFANALVAHYAFDDGPDRVVTGDTDNDVVTLHSIENYAFSADWLKSWEHAARIMKGEIRKVVGNLPGEQLVDGDGDGIGDDWEIANFGNLTTAGKEQGVGAATTPTEQNRFADGYTDSDADGLNDLYEYILSQKSGYTGNYDPKTPNSADLTLDEDNDGLDNLGEQRAGTDPTNVDTDDDGLYDGYEVTYMKNPLRAEGTKDMAVRLAAGSVLTFPAKDAIGSKTFIPATQIKSGDAQEISFGFRLASLGDTVLFHRGNVEFGDELTISATRDGRVIARFVNTVTGNAEEVVSSSSIEAGKWAQVTLSFGTGVATLTVASDVNGNGTFSKSTVKSAILYSNYPNELDSDITLGANSTADGAVARGALEINDLTVTSGGTSCLEARFNDLGAKADNMAAAKGLFEQYDREASGFENTAASAALEFVAVRYDAVDDADKDYDGMKDSWETGYFQTVGGQRISVLGTEVADAATDYDHDGLTDLYEYLTSLTAAA
ncbi:MAG: S8 family serine peptidase, partial [Victivallales bacterium]|nr:S8 family serine peptidase [Victivallales bacterium]